MCLWFFWLSRSLQRSAKEATHFIETAPISEADRDKICHVNTERLLRL
jgi:hypothetical protein